MLAKALASASASAPKVYVEDVFSTYLYTGNGSTQTITNGIDLSGKGGLVWLKSRVSLDAPYTNIELHCLFDNIRTGATGGTAGGGGRLRTDSDQQAQPETYLNSYNSNGFTLVSPSVVANANLVNQNGKAFASWTFRKAAKFFDVVTYTGNGTAGRQIPHNLGSVPGFIIVKRTNVTGNWECYHRSLGNTQTIRLNLTNAAATTGDWNSTTPTSSVFTVNGSPGLNGNGDTYVAYLFAHDAGGFGDSGNESVVSCGSFTPDGSGNATVTLGWEPQWVLYKRSAAAENWKLVDNMRGFVVGAGNDAYIFPNTSGAEVATTGISPVSTGFTIEGEAPSSAYIYIAIRRGPMKTPTDATKVFDADAVTTSAFVTTGFPVDATFIKERNVIRGPFATARLLGGVYAATSSISSFGSPGATPFMSYDSNVGGQSGLAAYYGAENGVFYNFRRAPGFFDVVCGNAAAFIFSGTHNLGAVPEMIISKDRAGASNWAVYHASIGVTKYLYLNTTNAEAAASPNWGATSTTFSDIGTAAGASNACVAYLFASCPGVSKVGSYTGTGTTLNIDCGFTAGARFVLIKRTDSTGDWYVYDTARGIVSGNDPSLLLNSTAAEVTNTDYIDPLSSGFQISSTAPAAINANGGSYIFLSVA